MIEVRQQRRIYLLTNPERLCSPFGVDFVIQGLRTETSKPAVKQ